MDSLVVKNAIGGLEKLLSQARRALWEITRDRFVGGGDYDDQGSYADPRAALSGTLEELHDVLLVILEAAQMPDVRSNMGQTWPKFISAAGSLSHTDEHPDYDACSSPAFTFLERIVNALRMTVSEQITSEEAWIIARLEAMLEDTPGLVHRKGNFPARETDLQEIMHDYLSACFPDFRKNPHIGGSIKNFIPDCGIASVGAAIEFKIAHTKQEAITGFNGIVEDVGGYKGSKDWTRFYAVMYQAQPFIRKSELQSDMKRIKAATWKAILVNGSTNPRPSKSASLKPIAKKAIAKKPVTMKLA